MSVFYEVNEHLVIKNTELHYDVVSYAHSQLCLMGAWMLMQRGRFDSLSLRADGVEYRFSGKRINEDYHNLVDALMNAHSIELISSYGYSSSVSSVDPGPFQMLQYLQEIAEEEPEALKGVFYSMYHNADCGSSAGALAVYGEKNGRLYTGKVEFEAVDSIPDGDWYTPQTAVYYEPEDTQDLDLPAILEVCRQLCEFSCYDDLHCTEEGEFSFFLNNLRIRTDDQLKRFLALYAQLIELTDGGCGLIGELADISSPDVRMLEFDVEADGTYTLRMAAV